LYIAGVVIAVAVAFVAVVLIASLYKVPSCTDNTQNQGEAGVDCGGPCPYLCTASESAPVVQFARALTPQAGRTDVIAYVQNQNTTAAAYGAPYRVDLYSAGNVLIASSKGTVDLPPKSTVPVFIPNFFSGNQEVAHAFLTFDTGTLSWQTYSEARTLPKVASAVLTRASTTPHITAVIQNDDVNPLFNIKVIATVFDAGGNAVGASQTVLPTIGQQGSATAVFTWNTPFPAPIARIEVTPLLPLPQ
jgi:hypothetical protein